MILFAYLAIFAMPLAATLYLFAKRASARSVATVIVFGWLFLPLVAIKFVPGIPVYDKSMAIGLGALAGVLIARPKALMCLRPGWWDVPIVMWCLVPIASSVTNGLGIYDGLATAFRQTVVWGFPYLVGRSVFAEPRALVDLAKVLLIGGAVYLPLCLFESRMSPQLHLWVYGVGGAGGLERIDFFGPLRYKPSVFLYTTLELTPLMGAAALCGFWLWRAGGVRRLGRWSMGWLVAAAGAATVLGKALGGVSLTVAGGLILVLIRRFRQPWLLAAVLLVAPAYMAVRAVGIWSGHDFVAIVADYASQRRADSLGTRIENEDRLTAKALERPWFGWGAWGRWRVYNEEGADITRSDGMWVVALGQHGIVGLAAFYGTLLLPALIVIRRFGRRLLEPTPGAAAVLVAAVILVLHSVDCLFNAMPNPIYLSFAGGLAGVAAQALPRPHVRGPVRGVRRELAVRPKQPAGGASARFRGRTIARRA